MKKIFLFLIVVIIGFACKKKSSDGGTNPANPPGTATLIFPTKNEKCISGIITSDTESTISFTWNASTNTDSYEVNIKNLFTNASVTYISNSTKLNAKLLRNTPYSWFVTSKSNKVSTTATSEVWKFYNAGIASVSYAPFPAEIVSPKNRIILATGITNIELSWIGVDIDGDLINYDVYYGTSDNPPIFKANYLSSSINNLSIKTNTNYYWKIISRDAKGNTSDSGLMSFSSQ